MTPPPADDLPSAAAALAALLEQENRLLDALDLAAAAALLPAKQDAAAAFVRAQAHTKAVRRPCAGLPRGGGKPGCAPACARGGEPAIAGTRPGRPGKGDRGDRAGGAQAPGHGPALRRVRRAGGSAHARAARHFGAHLTAGREAPTFRGVRVIRAPPCRG